MPTHYPGTEREKLALDAYIKLSRCLNSIQSRLLPELQRVHGITESQFAVLEALHHLGPLSQGQLCGKILRSGSNVTTVVDNLERDGLVRRERDATDRRVQIVSITAEGEALISEVMPTHVDRIATGLAALTDDEQRELARLCKKLGTKVATETARERESAAAR